MKNPTKKRGVRSKLPERMRSKTTSAGRTYYYYDCGYAPDGKRRWIALGADYVKAVKQWAEYEQEVPKHVATYRDAAEAYFASEEFAEKAPATQRDYLGYHEHLLKFFDDPPAPLDAIEPQHIQQYHERRSKASPTQANRNIAFFSLVFNFARRFGYTKAENPKKGVRRNKEEGRDVYIEHDVFLRLCRVADRITRDTLWLLYLTGQRPNDTVNMKISQLKRGAIAIKQRKTGQLLDMFLSPRLQVVIRRCIARRTELGARGTSLLVNERGADFTYSALRSRFDDIREKVGIKPGEVQLRDVRAKAGTDVKNARGYADAQALLGHKDVKMTQTYVRQRRGDTVKPTR